MFDVCEDSLIINTDKSTLYPWSSLNKNEMVKNL